MTDPETTPSLPADPNPDDDLDAKHLDELLGPDYAETDEDAEVEAAERETTAADARNPAVAKRDPDGPGPLAEGDPGDSAGNASPSAPAEGEPAELSAAEELERIKEQMRQERIDRDNENAAFRRQIAQLRESRREARAAADEEEEKPDRVIPNTWGPDGEHGTPLSAIEEAARRVVQDSLARGEGGGPAEPILDPYQQWQQEQYANMRSRFIEENPDGEPVLVEHEQAYAWLDQEYGRVAAEQGFSNPAGNPAYLRSFFDRSGIARRFADRFPRVAEKGDLVEFVATALSGDPSQIADYVGRSLTKPESPNPAPTPVEKVVPHPSHARAGRGTRGDTESTQRERLKELMGMETLKMSDEEWDELEALERKLLDGAG